MGHNFNRHKVQFESGGLQTTFSRVYYFLPSTTDRSEKINRNLGSVNISPIDVPENTFETENNVALDPSKLDMNCPEKEVMTQAVVRILQKITDFPNSNFIQNADGLLSRKSTNVDVEWFGQLKQRLSPNKYKTFY